MKTSLFSKIGALLLLASQTAAQVSWQFSNGPYYANIDDLSTGESGGQVSMYATASPNDEISVFGIVLKSTDRGESWVHKDIPGATGRVTCVATFRSNPNIVYAGVSSQGIYKSTNGGDTWTPTATPLNTTVSRIALHPTNSGIVWAGCLRTGSAVLYRSTNGGADWVQMNIGAPNLHELSVSDIAVAENTNYVWVSTYSGTGANEGVWQTVDGGSGWNRRVDTMNTSNLDIASLAIDPNNPDVLYAGNRVKDTQTRRIYKTTTGTTACTWVSKYTGGTGSWGFSDLRVSRLATGLVYASAGPEAGGIGVLKSSDGGTSWSALGSDIPFKDLTAIELDPLDASILFTAGFKSHYKSSNAGVSWQEKNRGAILPTVGDVASNNGRLLAIGKPEYVFRRDGGSTEWNLLFDAAVTNDGNLITSMALSIDPASSDNALFGWEDKAGDHLHMWRTTNGGLDWSESTIGNPRLLTDLAYKSSQIVFGTLYHTGYAWVIKSTNAGVAWTETQLGGTGAELRSVTVSGSSIYVGGRASSSSGPTVYKSTDEGILWTNLSSGLPTTTGGLVHAVSADPSNESIVYAATAEGVYRTVTGGSSWTYSSPTTNSFKSLVVHPANTTVVYAVTDDAVTPHFYRSTNSGQSWSEMSTGLPSAKVHTLNIDPISPNAVYAATELGVYSITHIWTGSINVNTTWKTGQTYLVEGVLTITGGKNLTVQQGTRAEFMSGARMDVKGELLTSGTSSQNAVFTRNGSTGSWTGIVIENASLAPTATLTYARIEHCNTALRVGTNTTFSMNNCTVDDATTGVEFTTFSGSAPTATITNSTFSNIAATGILVTSFSNLTIDNNNITQSLLALPPTSGMRFFSSSPKVLRNKVKDFTRGVQCLNSSSPSFQNGSVGGYNSIKNNATGIYIKDLSNPVLGERVLGTDEGGQNCIFGNSGFEVVLINNSHSLAENNYWGSPFDPLEFSVETGSSIDYDPYLSSCPPGAMNIGGGKGDGGNPHMSPIPLLLLEAIDEYSRGNYTEAIVIFEAVIADVTIPQYAMEWAITQLLACGQHLNASDISSYLEVLQSTNPELIMTIDFILPHVYEDEGLINEATAAFESNITEYPNSELERDGLFSRFLNTLYVEADTSAAHAYLSLLELGYPESDEAFVASIQFEDLNAIGLNRGEVPNLSPTGRENLPTDFSLSQNFPNPFNPLTVINYGLPVDANVSLKLYDILGREITSLVEEPQLAGYHHVTFDGTRLASGVYFYRFTADNFTDTKRLVLIK